MKTVFITTDSCGGKFIANILKRNGFLDALIIEKEGGETREKLKRDLKKAPLWKLPVKIIDFFSVFIYSGICSCYLHRHLLLKNNFASYPQNIPLHIVENASDANCVSLLKSLNPDILVVLGTSILKPEVISIPKKFILNIHGGIVPQYRNVHSDFWAFINRDYDNIGTSIIHLNSGIDTGDVALQSCIEINRTDNLLTIKNKNINLAGNLIIEALNLASCGLLKRSPQNHAEKGVYRTPGFLDFLSLTVRTIVGIREKMIAEKSGLL